jgi:hypothetical protein
LDIREDGTSEGLSRIVIALSAFSASTTPNPAEATKSTTSILKNSSSTIKTTHFMTINTPNVLSAGNKQSD